MNLRNYWPVILWSTFVLILMGIPGSAFPKVSGFWDWIGPDKVAHLFLFGIFFYLLLNNTGKHKKESRLKSTTIFWLFLVGIVFAFITEMMQAKVFVNRNGNLFDFLANVLGCMGGLAIYLIKTKKKHVN